MNRIKNEGMKWAVVRHFDRSEDGFGDQIDYFETREQAERELTDDGGGGCISAFVMRIESAWQ